MAKQRVAVITWNLSNNSVGRAFVLADMLQATFEVEIIGPAFARYGNDVWGPIRHSPIKIRKIHGQTLAEIYAAFQRLVELERYDFALVSKARLPGMLLGLLLKTRQGCPLVLDVDEYETPFTGTASPLTPEGDFPSECEAPYGAQWTHVCQALIPEFKQLTVSNDVLRAQLGGIVVRHGRNENAFNPKLYRRDAIRSQFRYSADDKVVLFLGTARAHKGLQKVAKALRILKDPRAVLCIIGARPEDEIIRRLNRVKGDRIDIYPGCSWEQIPQLILLADAVCLLQEEGDQICDTQFPAKFTDAIAMCVPVLVSAAKPFEEMVNQGCAIQCSEEDLPQILRKVFDERPDNLIRSARAMFIQEFSYAVNRQRLVLALKEAPSDPPSGKSKLLLGYLSDRLGDPDKDIAKAEPRLRSLVHRPHPPHSQQQAHLSLCVTFLWKGNDSGIYGRRHEMLAKYAGKHSRVRQVVHFDAPVSQALLHKHVRQGANWPLHHGRLVARNILSRHFRLLDDVNVKYRVHLYSDAPAANMLGFAIPSIEEWPAAVRDVLEHSGSDSQQIAWVFPPNPDVLDAIRTVQFDKIIVDFVDDGRSWAKNESERRRVVEEYQQYLDLADVAITNSAELAARLQKHSARKIHVVENASERTDETGLLPLWQGDRPVVGYIGNLQDRIDVPLLVKLSETRPEYDIVLIGSLHGAAASSVLEGLPNVHFVGPVPYPVSLEYVRFFDVGIIPHLVNDMTEAMNPLKSYIYSSCELPCVATNIAGLGPDCDVARDDDEFIRKIDSAIERGLRSTARRTKLKAQLGGQWTARLDQVFKLLDGRT